jgi:glycosyltransferase involved in cell wall biosynthesis/ubiquinone/menaquinone biosynthesis C-methylase UbiE
MRVCYFGTYERTYPRNDLIIKALRQANATVVECHTPVWEHERDKSRAYRGITALKIISRLLFAYIRLIIRYLRLPAHDVVIVGYIGQVDMFLAWVLTRLRAVPLVFNPLVSLYDTFCDDRDIVSPTSLTGRTFWLLDAIACHAADMILLDTRQHVDYFIRTFSLPQEKFRIVPVGADDYLFKAQPSQENKTERVKTCEVLFVGKLIPLHGIETILRAAASLQEEAIHFTIIGSGQHETLVRQLMEELDLKNITLINWVEYEYLSDYYARADICLGIFGTSDKASRVIPNKVFQALAVGRPIITADTPALRTEFCPGEELWVCQPANASDLAQQITKLANDEKLRHSLAQRGFEAFQQRYNLQAIAHKLGGFLAELVPGSTPGDQMTWGEQPEFYGPRHRFRENYLLSAIQHYVPGPGQQILDVACGAGTLARRLAEHKYNVMGIDLSRSFLDYLHKHSTEQQLQLVQGDITRIPCYDNQLDGVVAGEVLEHLIDDTAALHEIWRVLCPGGICVISVPANSEQWDWHDNWAGHIRRYQREELLHKLETVGFVVKHIHYFGFPFVRMFHRYVYLPRYRRKLQSHKSQLNQLSTNTYWQKLVIHILLVVFQLDNLFNQLPLGIGLIAIVQKPVLHPE